MRGYECFFYFRSKDNKKLYPTKNNACWANVDKSNLAWRGRQTCESDNDSTIVDKDLYESTIIYIDRWNEGNQVTNKNCIRIVNLINNITECKFITINNKKYIKYKLLDHYSSDLVLLNIIRMLWYEPGYFNIEQYYKDIHKRKPKDKDSLEFIYECVKDNVRTVKKSANSYEQYDNHSCINLNIKPKTSEQLYKYKGSTQVNFLCN